MTHTGKCPCGCGKEVPSGRFWASRYCARKGRAKGIYMPVTLRRTGEKFRAKHGTKHIFTRTR